MVPVRTCLGCRRRVDRSTLVRVVARGTEAVVDRFATLDGRGAWVHPERECIETALQRKAFGRALRAEKLGAGMILDTRQILTIIEASTEAPTEQAD